MSVSETPKETSEKVKLTIPGTSSPKIPFINTPPKSSDVSKRQEKPILSPTLTSPVSAISSYLKHLLGLNAKTTKRSINEGFYCFFFILLKMILIIFF